MWVLVLALAGLVLMVTRILSGYSQWVRSPPSEQLEGTTRDEMEQFFTAVASEPRFQRALTRVVAGTVRAAEVETETGELQRRLHEVLPQVDYYYSYFQGGYCGRPGLHLLLPHLTEAFYEVVHPPFCAERPHWLDTGFAVRFQFLEDHQAPRADVLPVDVHLVADVLLDTRTRKRLTRHKPSRLGIGLGLSRLKWRRAHAAHELFHLARHLARQKPLNSVQRISAEEVRVWGYTLRYAPVAALAPLFGTACAVGGILTVLILLMKLHIPQWVWDDLAKFVPQ